MMSKSIKMTSILSKKTILNPIWVDTRRDLYYIAVEQALKIENFDPVLC